MNSVHLTFDLLPVFSVLLALAGFLIPGFKGWYGNLTSEVKQLFMLGLIALAAAATSVLSYFGLVNVYPVSEGLRGLVWYPIVDIVIALCVNAGVYKGLNYTLGPKDKPTVG